MCVVEIYKRIFRYQVSIGLLPLNLIVLTNEVEQAILEFVGHTLQAKSKGEHTASVFLDLSKAFDALDHSILLFKLERYGVQGTPLEWFKNYLKDRSLVAKVTTGTNQIFYSDKFGITFGTAQGSCLGSLLFIIFVMTFTYYHYTAIWFSSLMTQLFSIAIGQSSS